MVCRDSIVNVLDGDTRYFKNIEHRGTNVFKLSVPYSYGYGLLDLTIGSIRSGIYCSKQAHYNNL